MGRDTGQMFPEVSGHVTTQAGPAGLAQIVAVKLWQFNYTSIEWENKDRLPSGLCSLSLVWRPLAWAELWQGIASAD